MCTIVIFTTAVIALIVVVVVSNIVTTVVGGVVGGGAGGSGAGDGSGAVGSVGGSVVGGGGGSVVVAFVSVFISIVSTISIIVLVGKTILELFWYLKSGETHLGDVEGSVEVSKVRNDGLALNFRCINDRNRINNVSYTKLSTKLKSKSEIF